MDSKIFTMLLAAFILVSCGADGNSSKGIIGSPLQQESGIFNSYGIETSKVFVVDETTDRLLGIGLSDFAIKHQFELKKKEDEHVTIMDINEKFVIDFSKKHLNIYGLDGGVYDRPFNFQGTPTSAAYNPFTRTMIIQDNLQSVGMMQLAENGSITSSWLGGPQLASGTSIVAGDLDKTGRLVLAMSDETMAVVDVTQSIAQQSWQQTAFSPGLGKVTWVAPDNRNPDLLLVSSSTKIAIINSATKVVVDQKTLDSSSSIRFSSKAGLGHVFTEKAGVVSLYFINSQGAIGVESLAQASLTGLKQSFLSADAASITLLFEVGYRERSVLKMRLSDALVEVEKSIDTTGETSINGSTVFVNFKDPLGALELHSLTSDDVKRLEGYNFDYLRAHN
jgi:hypothetical protein